MANYRSLFRAKSVIGMIHLAGENPIERARREIEIYRLESVDGVIVEDYHGTIRDVERTLASLKGFGGIGLKLGVNVLSNPAKSFALAKEYGAQFVQLDGVQFSEEPELARYNELRVRYSEIVVFGGVRFKYQFPTGKSLEQDVADALPLCDAIVTTGEGTGMETPIGKLAAFRNCMPADFPLVVGAGVNAGNAREQYQYADCAIIGSGFKPKKNTRAMVSRELVRSFMSDLRDIRGTS